MAWARPFISILCYLWCSVICTPCGPNVFGLLKSNCNINLYCSNYQYLLLDLLCNTWSRESLSFLKFIFCRSALPTRIQKFTVLKSAHIFKKHRVQYEIRTHVRQLQIKEITGTTADVFLEYIQRNLPEGVSMTVYQVSLLVSQHAHTHTHCDPCLCGLQEQMDTLPTLLMTPYQDPSAPPLPTKDGRKKKWWPLWQ